jgi:hypothetical protein
MVSLRRLAAALTVPLLLATACSSDPAAGVDSSADEINYRSTSGQEFALSTTVTFKPSAESLALMGEAQKAAILAEAEKLRNLTLSTITSELDKLWPEEMRTTSAGVAIQYRQASAALSDLTALPGDAGYSVTVTGEFAGVKDLEKKLPQKTVDGKTFLPITADLGAGSVDLQVTVTPIERSLNAYPKYLDMFADGLDIGVHIGGDHDTPPQDIDHARSVYDDLVASGFKSPVAKFEDLKIDSGPLTSAIKVKDKVVPVRVSIFHVDMSTPETRSLVIDAYKNSVKTADVIIYDGHAGRQLDYSGVVLAYNPARASIPATQFKDFVTTDKQQVYLFNGCETYTGYADKLYENPNRNTTNTDVITTGNFSAIQAKANQVISFIHSFIDQKNGLWIPRSWDSVLQRMNAIGERSWVHVYGVHGLDDNPKASPLADVSKVGVACTQDSECGAPDSKCMVVSSTSKVCGMACADTVGCPTGTACVLPKNKTSADDQQCAPR